MITQKDQIINLCFFLQNWLVGLSFGAILVWQIAIQLQMKTSAVVRKIFLLNGTPDFQKAEYNEIMAKLETTDDKEKANEQLMGIMLIKFTEYLIKRDGLDLLEEQLMKITDLKVKADKVIAMISNKFNFDIKNDKLLNLIKSICKKMQMICELETKDKFKGDIMLIRAQEIKSSLVVNAVNETLGVEKMCTGKSEVFKMIGDHSSFLIINAKDIGHLIDCNTAYLSI